MKELIETLITDTFTQESFDKLKPDQKWDVLVRLAKIVMPKNMHVNISDLSDIDVERITDELLSRNDE